MNTRRTRREVTRAFYGDCGVLHQAVAGALSRTGGDESGPIPDTKKEDNPRGLPSFSSVLLLQRETSFGNEDYAQTLQQPFL
jgi:hypothetical protein